MSNPIDTTMINAMLASGVAMLPLHLWTRFRLRKMGLHEEVRPSLWLQGLADPYPLRLVMRLRGRVGALDWAAIVAYCALWVVASVLFVIVFVRFLVL